MKTLTTTNLEQKIMVFKTNIKSEKDLHLVSSILNFLPGVRRWIVDLDDWEKVLKVETDEHLKLKEIENLIGQLGFDCQELDH